jgi:hypothetical protein
MNIIEELLLYDEAFEDTEVQLNLIALHDQIVQTYLSGYIEEAYELVAELANSINSYVGYQLIADIVVNENGCLLVIDEATCIYLIN